MVSIATCIVYCISSPFRFTLLCYQAPGKVQVLDTTQPMIKLSLQQNISKILGLIMLIPNYNPVTTCSCARLATTNMSFELEIGCKQGFQYTPRKISEAGQQLPKSNMQKICQRYLFSIIILHVHPKYASHIYMILKEYIESLRLISLYAL